MKQKWKERSPREQFGVVVNAILTVGMLLSMILYFARILHLGKDIAWLLFCLHYFTDAFAFWKTDRDNAVRALILGCMLSLFVGVAWMGILLL